MAAISHQSGSAPVLQQHEFVWIKDFLYKRAGIVLNDNKQAMVVGRLEKRLRHHGLTSYTEYFRLFGRPGFENETTMAIDLLTTNETYFFREPKHFEYLTQHILPNHSPSRTFRVWSAASSSGEEAYTLAMLLADHARLGPWEIVGTDISNRILEKARRGLYPTHGSEKIPPSLLKKYCLKGTGEFDGYFLIDPALRKHVKFIYANLIGNLPKMEMFDVIFLRNVMIYFDMETKQRLLERITKYLLPGGYFYVSHSESLNGMKTDLQIVTPSIYRKPVEA
ncbi:protein-glutamate O-methyltransferase CheR [Methylomonas sp. EFPC3]|uniref:CheR family methyltransferase n=1 Tax=Methylomonas TaxID=416 RepID=UPI00112AF3D3|nr:MULTISPECIES: protein-glutamate O-methyltransferase CheR [Methylomonas]TPQ24577.1 SAM-dependent methyltransferase [Methylomonas koyamae]WFP49100.1 protein-glutamate O-methyltransferase CheR [Methylomonas sp. EFPC3]